MIRKIILFTLILLSIWSYSHNVFAEELYEEEEYLNQDDDTIFENDYNSSNNTVDEISLWELKWAIPWGLDRISESWVVRWLDWPKSISVSWDALYSVNGWSYNKTNTVRNWDVIKIKMSPSNNYSNYKESKLVLPSQIFTFSISTQSSTSTNTSDSSNSSWWFNSPKIETRNNSCSWLPENWKLVWGWEYLQTKVWDSWLPAYVPVEYYKNSNSLCKFDCNNWYNWSWTICAEIQIEDEIKNNDIEVDENLIPDLKINYREFETKNYHVFNIKFEELFNNLIKKEKNKWYEEVINKHINSILFWIYIYDWSEKWTSRYYFSIKILKNNIVALKKYL